MTEEKCILVVGGAGYIGSHMCKALARSGYLPVVLDNLGRGHREAVQWGPLVTGDMDDSDLLDRTFSARPFEAVMHFAAFAYVGESVTDPALYYRNNLAAPMVLLDAMRRHGMDRFIFSSTCAIYGEPNRIPIAEDHPQRPINPYGWTKKTVEQILADYGRAYGLKSVSLRYFNAAGADPDGEIGEDHDPETHLIPLVLQTALGQRDTVRIFGDDYPTEDGTCIRDYVHVNDLADAHLLALERLLAGGGGGAYNLGNGRGFSVQEVIHTARRVTGCAIPAEKAPRRPGDPARLIGSSDKFIAECGWRPRFADLESMVTTAWNWHRNHPDGYGD
ncbi:MAG: UDP-glucose 4-epimerase GalE [Desulfobacterales bacterium]|nr:UDP-glucose 4-epimerase GalE [Desulfobacterales bacterium]